MRRLDEIKETIVEALPNKVSIVPAGEGIELVVNGGLKGSEWNFVEAILWDGGFRLERIYFHRNRDALVFRFKEVRGDA